MTAAQAPTSMISSASKRAIVFVHYDAGGDVDPHVIHALAAYRRVAERLVVVSNSSRRLPAAAAALVDTFVPRTNVGYDFCGWRDGLATLERNDFDEVICVNDSVYGPLFDLNPVLERGRATEADMWGMVLSDQAAHRGQPRIPHVQSWFFAMRRRLLISSAYERFWSRVEPLVSKRGIIDRYEVGLSRDVTAAGLRIAGIYDATCTGRVTLGELLPHLSLRDPRRSWRLVRKGRRRSHNPSELVWWRLLEAGVPYVKVGLFRVNHYGVDLRRVLACLRQDTPYDVGLIDAHSARCG